MISKMQSRGGELLDMVEGESNVKLTFHIPARFLLGFFPEFISETKGNGLLSKEFDGYVPYRGEKALRSAGVLTATEKGTVTSYALDKLQDRGIFFVEPGEEVYENMIIGQHNRSNDLALNVVRAKQLTNVRASGKDDLVKLTPKRQITIEIAISYIIEGEKIEITPKRICLVK
jgi:GTP-binding protein